MKVYLDGRDQSERRTLISLNLSDPDFSHQGKTLYNSWVENGDGTLTEHLWVFKEKGIESVLGRLRLSANTADDEEEEEDMLSKTLASAGITASDGDASPGDRKVGQIVITVNKVTLGTQYIETAYNRGKKSTLDDTEMDDADQDVTHTATRVPKKNIYHGPKKCQAIHPYEDDEKPLATFVFFYRSSETLTKMGFLESPTTSRTTTRSRRAMDFQLANLTPLSFLNGKTVAKDKNKDSALSYEEKVRGCSFKPDLPKMDFGHQYREYPSPVAKGEKSSSSKLPIVLPSIEEDGYSDTYRERNQTSSEISPLDEITSLQKQWNQPKFKAPKLHDIVASLDAKVNVKGGWKSQPKPRSGSTKDKDEQNNRNDKDEPCKRTRRTSLADQMPDVSKAQDNLESHDREDDRQAEWASKGPRNPRIRNDLGRDEVGDSEGRRRSRRLRHKTQLNPTPATTASSSSLSQWRPQDKTDQDGADMAISAYDGDESQGSISMDTDSGDDPATESELDFDEDGLDKGETMAMNVEEEDETHVGLRRRLGDIAIKKRSREDGEDDARDGKSDGSAHKKRQGS